MKKLIRSQSFDCLAECLFAALSENTTLLRRQWVIVPSPFLKGWLSLKLARLSATGGIAGVKIATVDEFFSSQFRQIPKKLEMRVLIYQALSHEWSEELSTFLSASFQSKWELTIQLADLFFSYGRYEEEAPAHWQIRLYKALFSSGPFLMPNQILPQAKWKIDQIHCFGIDSLPPLFWQYLANAPTSIFYHFSPSFHFWEDVCTDKEQRHISQKAKNRGVSVEEILELRSLLEEAPPLLANLGKIGRETLKILDPLELDDEPVYALPKSETVLALLQKEIISFQKEKQMASDGSIRIFKTGASKLREVEILCDEIIRLSVEKKIPFSEMLVLSPDIAPYVPIIEFVFSSKGLPYRFPYVSVEKQSSFHQGILRLIALCKGNWTAEKIITLVETASFFKKANLQSKEVSLWASWIEEMFSLASSWEEGFSQMLQKACTLSEGPRRESLSVNAFDLLEKCLETLESLKTDCLTLSKKLYSLEKWASLWEEMAQKYVHADFEDERDVAAKDSFSQTLKMMRESSKKLGDVPCPFEMIESCFAKPIYATIYGNHLHAICFASLKEGSVIPSSALFMIGMDEDHFPRKNTPSSMDLLKKDPELAQVDRYVFLQSLLNVKECLYFSYGHLSEDEGKPVGPSLLIQELLHHLGESIEIKIPKPKIEEEKHFAIFSFGAKEAVPQEDQTILLSDLVAFSRDPWKYYLQKVHRIYLEDRGDRSFAVQRSQILKSSLEWPLSSVFDAKKEKLPGLFQEAFVLEVSEKEKAMRDCFSKWGKKIVPISFLETARNKEGEFCPLELVLSNGSRVRILGNIPLAVEDGAFLFGDDKIGTMLKTWPEILATCCALKTSNVYALKSGKIKSIANPEESLKKFLEYYLRCKEHISPLLPDWADALLRKPSALKFGYETVVNQWMECRLEIPPFEKLSADWIGLKTTFSDLIALYPTRGSSED